MALPVLDGNQSATTLSSVVTGGEHIVAHSVVSLGANAISNITTAVSGAVVTIPSLDSIRNSVATDSVLDSTTNFIKIGGHQSGSNQTAHIVHVSNGGAMSVDASGSSVTFGLASVTFSAVSISNFPSTQTIAGTVTVNVATRSWYNFYGTPTESTQFIAVGGYDTPNGQIAPIPLTDGASGVFVAQDASVSPVWNVGGTVTVGAVPNGSLTTRFGTPTTASVAFATTAVTNANRKYLLIQNVTTASNVITVGIGFTPTTTQGIQLTAGAGITFESSYIPTGAVYVLSSVTASNFTILEA